MTYPTADQTPDEPDAGEPDAEPTEGTNDAGEPDAEGGGTE
jgi:hypothetical protein